MKRLNVDTNASGGLIGLLERLEIFFSKVHGQDSNVLFMYGDESDLYSVEVSMGSPTGHVSN